MKSILHVKIQLLVSAKYDQDPNSHDPHWFGSLDPDLHGGKKIMIRIRTTPWKEK
jgi:hypothetical protein